MKKKREREGDKRTIYRNEYEDLSEIECKSARDKERDRRIYR